VTARLLRDATDWALLLRAFGSHLGSVAASQRERQRPPYALMIFLGGQPSRRLAGLRGGALLMNRWRA
jgi:hypothetical protein